MNIRKFYRHYPLTITASLVVLILTIESIVFKFDLYKIIINALNNIEYLRTEEILLSILFAATSFVIDHIRITRRQLRKETSRRDRMKVARAALSTAHDLVNNSLNNMLLVKIEAEKGAPLSKDTLALFGSIIDDLAKNMHELNELDVIYDRPLSESISVLEKNNTKHMH